MHMRIAFRLILVLIGLSFAGAAFAQPTSGGSPNNPNRTPLLGNNEPFQPPRPTAPAPIPIPYPNLPVPVPEPEPQIITRIVPFPMPRPIFRELQLPTVRPLLSLGRPALINAEFEPQMIVLLVDVSGSEQTMADIAREYGLTLIDSDTIDMLGVRMVKYRVPPGQTVPQAAEQLAKDPRVIGQQPNYLFNIAQDGAAPTDMRPLQYAPEKLHVVAAHEASTGAGIIVGIIDTAIDDGHPEFALNAVDQSDVLGGDVVSRGHGTAMGGLIVASSALDGVAPGVRLISVRAFDATANGGVSSSSFALAKALDRMAASNADVLNLSFAGPRDPLILKVMDRLEEIDMPVIAAAGNNGPDADPVYPAAHRHAIAVTATDPEDLGFAYANLGMYVEVAAPGVDILSPQPDGKYDYETGTSAATAQVTGIVALMLARNPDLTTADIRLALTTASRDLGAPGRDEVFGAGLVDASLAVASAAQLRQ